MTICSTCGAQNPDGAIFCDECGASLKSPDPQPVIQSPAPQVQLPPAAVAMPGAKNCPVCGAPAQPGGLFCENCGASLASEAPQPPAAAFNLPPTVAIPGAAASTPAPPPLPAPAPPSNPTCTNCGAILEQDSAFCDMCGTPVNAPSQTIDPVQSAPIPPIIPSPTPDVSTGFEPTLVGGYEAQQDLSQPQVDDYGTQQHYAATQVGDPNPSQSFEQPQVEGLGSQPPFGQPQAASYGVPQSFGQPQAGYGVPGTIQARFVIPGTNVSLPLLPGKYEFIVGREDPISNIFPDIDLTDYGGDEGGVSRQHARITLQDNQYYITDMQSTNYTYVNQQRLQPNLPTPLHNGDEILIGSIKLMFYQ